MKVRLLALAALTMAMACEGPRQPTAPSAPTDPSKVIRDGAHGGNKDFWWLPPLVPLALNNPDFQLGTFNNALRASLKIEICELKFENFDAQGLPTDATGCIDGLPIKTFAPGSVNLVNLPLRQNGWWMLFNLPPDGFYYVLWDTRQSNLSVNKFYRIKVLIDGSTAPLGIADVDPLSNIFQWRFTRTGSVVQLVNGFLLPIPFRVERGALCPPGSLCSSSTITNHTPNGDPQVVQVQGNNGPIAGVVIPDGWLPDGGPQSVVVTINSVNTGVNDVLNGTQQFPCHANLHLQQFNGCFNFSTIPALGPNAPGRHQFVKAVTVVACYVLHDTVDPREPYAQLFSSGPNEPAHPLVSVSDLLVLTVPTEHNCGSNFPPVIGSNAPWSNKLTQLASLSWQKVSGGIGHVFGVKTAYAVDLGLGGLSLDFSNVSPAINAQMSTGEFEPDFSVVAGVTSRVEARVIGTQKHDASALSTGIPLYPVTFALGTPDAGGFRPVNTEDPLSAQLTLITNSAPISPGSGGSGGGFVAADWAAPSTAGNYTLTASSPYAIGTITYHVFVRPTVASVLGAWQNENGSTPNIVNFFISEVAGADSVQAFGQCAPTDCDWGQTVADISLWDTQQQITAVWDQGFAIKTVTIKWLSPTRLQVTTHAAFAPGDGRTDYTITEFFQRST